MELLHAILDALAITLGALPLPEQGGALMLLAGIGLIASVSCWVLSLSTPGQLPVTLRSPGSLRRHREIAHVSPQTRPDAPGRSRPRAPAAA